MGNGLFGGMEDKMMKEAEKRMGPAFQKMDELKISVEELTREIKRLNNNMEAKK